MIVSIIVAHGKNREIGLGNAIPWRLSADLKRFKKLTTGHHMITGRKNFESIGRVLPDRVSVIITRQLDYAEPKSCVVVHSLPEALAHCKQEVGDDEVFIIGGGEIYARALEADVVDRMYLTEIDQNFEADVFFPEYDRSLWKETLREEISDDDSVDFSYRYINLERVRD